MESTWRDSDTDRGTRALEFTAKVSFIWLHGQKSVDFKKIFSLRKYVFFLMGV